MGLWFQRIIVHHSGEGREWLMCQEQQVEETSYCLDWNKTMAIIIFKDIHSTTCFHQLVSTLSEQTNQSSILE